MIIIYYEKTLEQELREKYNLKCLPYDIDPDGFWKAVGKAMAKMVIENVKLNINKY